MLLAGGYAVLETMRWILRLVSVDPALEWGLGLALSGAVLVVGSLIAERLADLKHEGDLLE